jgi:protein phosphatase
MGSKEPDASDVRRPDPVPMAKKPAPDGAERAMPAARASAPGQAAAPSSVPAAPTRDGDAWRPIVFSAGVTDVGKLRKHNEDHILLRADLGLFVVADGMGGHNAGDVASKLTTTSINNFFDATSTGPVPSERLEEDEGLAPDAFRLAAGVRKANHDVHEISSTHRQHRGMGSTVVSLFVPPASGFVHVAHVGDSRCYRHRDGKLEQLTRDHSLINDALELKPDLTPAELARLPKNIITRALGMKDAVLVDVRTEALRPGDTFLLCSDGLTGFVKEPQIREVLELGGDVREMAETLVAMANDGGGNDNISAVIVRAESEAPEIELVEVDALTSSAPPNEAKAAPLPPRPPPPPRPRPSVPGAAPAGAAASATTAATAPPRPVATAKADAGVASAPAEAPPRSPRQAPSRVAVTEDSVPEVEAEELLLALDTPAPPVPEVEAAGPLAPVEAAAIPEVDAADLLVPIEPDATPIAPNAARFQSDPLSRYKVACCRACGAELQVGTLFCVDCGKRIE